jgi:hypothetical protein
MVLVSYLGIRDLIMEIVLEINVNTVAADDIGCYSVDIDL